MWGVIHQPLALLEPVLHVLPACFNSTLEFIKRQREFLGNLEIREWGLFLEFFYAADVEKGSGQKMLLHVFVMEPRNGLGWEGL